MTLKHCVVCVAQSFRPNPGPLTQAASFQNSSNSGVFLTCLVCLREHVPAPLPPPPPPTHTFNVPKNWRSRSCKAWCELRPPVQSQNDSVTVYSVMFWCVVYSPICLCSHPLIPNRVVHTHIREGSPGLSLEAGRRKKLTRVSWILGMPRITKLLSLLIV